MLGWFGGRQRQERGSAGVLILCGWAAEKFARLAADVFARSDSRQARAPPPVRDTRR
ncbi:hypothetical protein UA75_04875 [Actinoalloteichus sp. GBA129-24]|uniref:Uncharacterized protein n=1 Tax=Actinoalloteichus fjordicus TaxID=1612552 RepID=A0AAC9L900_9PSEU|nr:hypothetical protein UA74_04760 [Actinoalloteichus fjordicus]APU19004.1 hypothetical protein UA75_04875 [Actinoalloteichus sp. GBA129-24]